MNDLATVLQFCFIAYCCLGPFFFMWAGVWIYRRRRVLGKIRQALKHGDDDFEPGYARSHKPVQKGGDLR